MTQALVLPFWPFDWNRPLFHSGRTDGSGGHYDTQGTSNLGAYHYHHGYSPHLHKPVCPYGKEKKTSLVSLLKKHNAELSTANIGTEEKPRYIFAGVIEISPFGPWIKVQFGVENQYEDGFYICKDASQTLFESFYGTKLNPSVVNNIPDSPWVAVNVGVDVLVDEAYFETVMAKMKATKPNDGIVVQDWLRLYTSPTFSIESKDGWTKRVVEIPEKVEAPGHNEYNWYAYEEINVIEKWPRIEMENKGIDHVVMFGARGEMIDNDGRYWVALGPKVMKEGYVIEEGTNADRFNWNKKIDAVLADNNGNVYYLPCVPGAIKEHTYTNAIYQTGYSVLEGHAFEKDYVDGSVIEFMGFEPPIIPQNNVLYDFKLVNVIVYEK